MSIKSLQGREMNDWDFGVKTSKVQALDEIKYAGKKQFQGLLARYLEMC